MIQLAQANAVRLPLEDGVVSLCVTSPPYWGLRSYDGEQVLTWGGDTGCSHVWETETRKGQTGGKKSISAGGALRPHGHSQPEQSDATTASCQRCQAWRGALGLEPTPDLFIEHLVKVFRDVRRCLSADGLCLVNLGDSYAGGGSGSNPSATSALGSGPSGESKYRDDCAYAQRKAQLAIPAKNLCLIPQRAAIALQADGWWVRSFMPWSKNNCLPESVKDRPTTAHEYWIMLAKSRRYYWDGEAVRVRMADTTRILRESARGMDTVRNFKRDDSRNDTAGGMTHAQHGARLALIEKGGRNRRTSDTWLDGLDAMIDEQRRYLAHLVEIRDGTGMLAGQDGGPLGVRFNTASYKGAHFATYPAKMIVPFVKAGSSERGACPVCRKAWVRVVDNKPSQSMQSGNDWQEGRAIVGHHGPSRPGSFVGASSTTTGWRPSCSHNAEPIPALVLDPFVGSGTTLEVARALGRDAIGFDLSFSYLRDQARERLSLTALDAWENGVDGGDDGQLVGLPMFDGCEFVQSFGGEQ